MKMNSIKEYILEKIDQNNSINIYTDEQWFYRIEKDVSQLIASEPSEIKNTDIIYLATYIIQLTYLQESHNFYEFDKSSLKNSAKEIHAKFSVIDNILNTSLAVAIEAVLDEPKTSVEAKIVSDAFLIDLSCPINGQNRLIKVYDQLVARGFFNTKIEWLNSTRAFLKSQSFQTNYASEHFSNHKKDIQKKLKKERKEIVYQNDLILEQELNINEKELKKLKKKLSKTKGQDDRGIQTIFRTTSKNHYVLKGLVDSKANIMITVNTIVLSLIVGRVMGGYDGTLNFTKEMPIIILIFINVFSIIFSVLAIAPIKTQGRFTEEEIRNKKGNLLYFGNFHNMKYPDFEWGFLELLNDRNYLYLSLIRDFYYQGLELQKKFIFIRLSLYIFLFGIILTTIAYLISIFYALNFQ